jgi:translation initiation factor 4A
MFKPRRTDDRRGGHRREYSHSSYPRDERAPPRDERAHSRYERGPRDDRPVAAKSRYHIEEKEEPHDEPDHTDEAAIEAPVFISNESGKYEFEKWEEEGSGVEFDIKLLRGIYAYGFDSPSPIQKKAILPMITGRDIIAQAQSGTGKTGAFSIASLALVNPALNHTQIIIVSPTRELSTQNYNVVKQLATYMDIRTQCLIGGISVDEDIRKYEEIQPHIVIGCTGRIYDLINRGVLPAIKVRTFVLDEADEMLSRGFKEQVYEIFKFFNENVQVALFSATIPEELNELVSRFMRDPIKILVKKEMLTLEGIEQFYVELADDHQKYLTIRDLYDTISMSQCIIYCNSVMRVKELTQNMISDQFPVVSIHSDMSQEERVRVFNEFKQGAYRVLISSDITARGIDIQQVSVVINFDVPKNIHTYLHRIGRSGRWGRKGLAINLVAEHDMRKLKAIEEYYNISVRELPASFSDKVRK